MLTFLTDLWFSVEKRSRMGDAKATRLTLNDELICLADDRAAISATLRFARPELWLWGPSASAVIDCAWPSELLPGTGTEGCASTVLLRSVPVCFSWTFTVPLPGSSRAT